jgi:riboflavin synthase
LFTGIIEDLGAIASLTRSAAGAVITIRTRLPLARIAVNGCCLTVTKKIRGGFAMDVSAESLRRTTLGQLQPGDRVNLERCLTLEKLLGGHLVSGHVDGVGSIVSIEPEGDSRLYTFDAPALVARYLVEKGSVAIDGISLTVFEIRPATKNANRPERNEHASPYSGRASQTQPPPGAASRFHASGAERSEQASLRAASRFSVSLIPHTLKLTTLGFKRPGDPVNLESDMLVKYVERVAAPYFQNGGTRGANKITAAQVLVPVTRAFTPSASGKGPGIRSS